MDLLDCVKRARATRDFTNESVAKDDIRFLLDVARRAGSGKNRQPWTFIVIEDEERRKKLASFGEYTSPLEQASAGILIMHDIRRRDDDDINFNEFDCGRAVQNLVLAAASRGLGTVPQSISDQSAAEDLVAAPDDKAVLLAIAVGHPEAEPTNTIEGEAKEDVLLDSGRQSLEEVVYWERHG
ncbi:nitroreductase family protein [Halorarius halobius]|uniref:nitroreductase family protein n=1 Tax=Halorarius halobius TaxID=2962671 RepID=UPI0020CEAAE9|nr:nitroreductase family protein [Halorarius halobius]